ncbi:MAG: 50S ribosomal protein L10 [Demequinaceae bacterium]|nr:50S ribosomal protein L10 [Demequinaceae bacterium]
MATPDKVAVVKEMTEKFRASSAVFVTEYRGLTVAQLAELRSSLRGVATFSVAKNTLIALAAKDAGVAGIDAHFSGPTAIAFVTGDPVAAAKSLKTFGKDHPALVLKGGVFEGKPLSATDVEFLASLESREVLLAKAAGAFKASLFGAAYVFQAPLSSAARTVDALRQKQEAAA